MRIILPIILFVFFLSNSFSQGGVNVISIPIDSIDKNYLNKEVKIDLLNTKKVSTDSLVIKNRFWTSYTEVLIDNKIVDVIEYNGRGTDYWYYDKAYVELHNYQNNVVFRVYKCVIKEINEDSIKFQWTLKPYNQKDVVTNNIKLEDVCISKSLISSLLIRK
ncbi:MAG: hypothetical protein ACX93I_09540 [Winogradskyella sp.]|jgi:hypothetical protein